MDIFLPVRVIKNANTSQKKFALLIKQEGDKARFYLLALTKTII
jgi:hypothetical protein